MSGSRRPVVVGSDLSGVKRTRSGETLTVEYKRLAERWRGDFDGFDGDPKSLRFICRHCGVVVERTLKSVDNFARHIVVCRGSPLGADSTVPGSRSVTARDVRQEHIGSYMRFVVGTNQPLSIVEDPFFRIPRECVQRTPLGIH